MARWWVQIWAKNHGTGIHKTVQFGTGPILLNKMGPVPWDEGPVPLRWDRSCGIVSRCWDRDLSRLRNITVVETDRAWAKDIETETLSRVSLISACLNLCHVRVWARQLWNSFVLKGANLWLIEVLPITTFWRTIYCWLEYSNHKIRTASPSFLSTQTQCLPRGWHQRWFHQAEHSRMACHPSGHRS